MFGDDRIAAGPCRPQARATMATYEQYYAVVRQIPRGRVTTYGTVATVAGRPGRARQVGYAMAAIPEGADVPWQRVINAKGEISERKGGTAFENIQRVLLEAEGVEFNAQRRVDLERFGWP